MNLGSGMTTLIGSGIFGYGDLIVDEGTTLQLTGPSKLLLDSLTLESGGELVIDDCNGTVQLCVVNVVDFQSGSIATQLGNSPPTFELQIAGATTSTLP